MSRRPAKRAFGARPSDADTWVLAPEILSSRDAESRLFTPRLTIDVTPDQRGRIKVTAFQPQIPLFGPMFFNHQPMVYVSWALLAAVWWFLYRSRMGLKLLAVGESPASAHALGLPVNAIRYGATLFGGAMAGLGGTFLAVMYTPMWVEGMTAGRGWIALALVVFATWRPVRVVLGAYLYGGITVAQLVAQSRGVAISPQLLSMRPYLATIAVLVFISSDKQRMRLNTPASLGITFRPAV